MKNHIYVLLSVFLWGVSQFLVDRLLNVFSPALLIMLRFLISGLLILLFTNGLPGRSAPAGYNKPSFRLKYILTGGLGAFGYYFLTACALSLSSVAFVSITGGVLPVLAIIFDSVIVKRNTRIPQLLGAVVSLFGMYLFSYEGNFKFGTGATVLVVCANICWLFYGYLKNKWNIEEDSRVLGYEFTGAALLSLLFFPSFKIGEQVTGEVILIFAAVVILSTILPYKLYLKGSRTISLSTASMYLNLLPVTSLLPVLFTGTLSLNPVQTAGMIFLVLSALVGKESAKKRGEQAA